MDFGIFNTPYTVAYPQGRRTAREVIDWDLQLTRWCDDYGLAEVFFAEHYTIGFEPSPAPDLMIAAAAQQTERVRLGAAAHLLPYHNPINLAHRLMWLDHMTGGRYIAGFAPGSFPTDARLFGSGSQNADMTAEAIEIIKLIWTGEPPFRYEGKFWSLDMPEYTEQWQGPHLKPLQRPTPEVLITGMQARSPSFQEAGRHGFAPMSQQVAGRVLCEQWDTYAQAASDHGHTPERARWRVLRDVLVADTDAEARRLAVDGAAGQAWNEHILPAFKAVRARTQGGTPYALGELLLEPGMDISELTVDWLADNFWLVGSPDTVVEKVTRLNAELGGFGTVVSLTFDYGDDPEPYRRHFELLGREVAPRVAHLGPKHVAAPAAAGAAS